MKQIVTKEALKDLSSDNPRIKYKRVKNLLTIAGKNPEQLYPHLPFFVKLLKSENNILKWMAIDIIGSLSRVDTAKRIDGLLTTLFGFLRAGKMITANHAIAALSAIASAKPYYQKKVTQELLKVEQYTYDTDECHNIALGKVIVEINSYFKELKQNDQVVEFVSRQINNSRAATRKKAENFLKIHKNQPTKENKQ